MKILVFFVRSLTIVSEACMISLTTNVSEEKTYGKNDSYAF
ncbi:hypothetical protein SDC9_124264 [bioreactor metagenome]|uniref:Uncharacterized protein n=1 Tax=bioreactor metagenome TaxID=1076179 RepID=A0A645CJZ6_9ZZZZ